MSPWNMVTIIVIVAALCCCSTVLSERPVVATVTYNLGDRQMIIGKHNVNEKSLVYALCRNGASNRIATCTIEFYSDVFNHRAHHYTREFDLVAEMYNGKIDVLEVTHWRDDKVFFVWREINQNNLRHTQVKIYTVSMASRSQFSMLDLKVDNRYDQKPQIFIIPYRNRYEITFMDQSRCGTEFCRITVNANNAVSTPISWFPNTGLIYALEPTDDPSRKLLINYGETARNMGVTKIYLINESGWTEIGVADDIDNLGWSVTNGIVSYCTYSECKLLDISDGSKRSKIFDWSDNPLMYAALFNLPNGENLALFCGTEENSYYRIIKIGYDGEEVFVHDVEELYCSDKPKYLTSQFFQKFNTEYCLSMFYSYDDNGTYQFTTYCFEV